MADHLPPLERVDKNISEPPDMVPLGATISTTEEDRRRINELPVYVTTVGMNDVDSLVDLEKATFPPNQRCSREKFIYRIGACGELCMGLFTSSTPGSAEHEAVTAATANSTDSSNPDRKGILLAHIIATKTANQSVLDDDMAMGGHNEEGRTIGIHSLAVLPGYQRKGYGSLLLKDFCQRMAVAENADFVALLTYDYLVKYYEKHGFVNKGKSKATFGVEGGAKWNDMLLDLRPLRDHMNDLEYEEDLEDDEEDEEERGEAVEAEKGTEESHSQALPSR